MECGPLTTSVREYAQHGFVDGDDPPHELVPSVFFSAISEPCVQANHVVSVTWVLLSGNLVNEREV